MNTTNQLINVTAEDKKAHKEKKALEKQKRKDKALQKSDNKDDDGGGISISNVINNNLADKVTKTIKDQEKQNRKEKPKQKNQKEISVDKSEKSKSIIDDQKPNFQLVKSSDRVSFSDSSLKVSTGSTDRKSSDLQKNKPETVFRKNDPKQVSYFKHLICPNRQISLEKTISQIPDSKIHPAIKKFGCDLDSFKIRGSTLRCLDFFNVLKEMIRDLPAKNNECFSETFSIAFNISIDFLSKCRPLSVPMLTAIDYLKINISRLREENTEKCRQKIINMIDQFQQERVDVAHEEIQNLVSNYIKKDSRILVYSYSEIVYKSILRAWEKMQKEESGSFQVFVVDVFPDFQGEKMMNALKKSEIPFCRTNLASIPEIMPEISLVLFGAHSIMPNNNVISASGTASVANTAEAFSKPVIVCAETYKFNVDNNNHFDGVEYNEIGNPDLLVDVMIKCDQIESRNNNNKKNCYEILKNWRNSSSNISVLDLLYDVIPGCLISGIICELGFISSSAASYVSRIKQPYY